MWSNFFEISRKSCKIPSNILSYNGNQSYLYCSKFRVHPARSHPISSFLLKFPVTCAHQCIQPHLTCQKFPARNGRETPPRNTSRPRLDSPLRSPHRQTTMQADKTAVASQGHLYRGNLSRLSPKTAKTES